MSRSPVIFFIENLVRHRLMVKIKQRVKSMRKNFQIICEVEFFNRVSVLAVFWFFKSPPKAVSLPVFLKASCVSGSGLIFGSGHK